MASRFYLSRRTRPVTVTADAGWETTAGSTGGRMETYKPLTAALGSAISSTTVTANGTSGNDTLLYQGMSRPLAGAQTITGNIKGQVRVNESVAGLDARIQVIVRVVSEDGSTVRGTLLAMSAAALSHEFNTALRNITFPLGGSTALSSVSANDGDRIVVEIGFRQHATAAGSVVISTGDVGATDLAEDETTTAANVPWVEFSQTLVFRTRLYLGNGIPYPLAEFTPAAEWDRTAMPSNGVRRQYPLNPQPMAALAAYGIQAVTDGASGTDTLMGIFISPPLDVNQTISGTVRSQVRAQESAAGSDQRSQLIIRVIQPDGTVRGTLLGPDTGALASEWSTTTTNRIFPKGGAGTLSSVSAIAGDRIVAEYGARRHAATNATAVIIPQDDGANDLPENETDTSTNLNAWIEFSQAITFAAESDTYGLATVVRGQVLNQSDSDGRVTVVRGQVLYHPVAAGGRQFQAWWWD